MTDQATRIVPAGWYEDPASPAHVRWWNGLAWTEHTALKPAAPAVATTTSTNTGWADTTTGSTAVDPVTVARIAEARELERQYGISTAEHQIMARATAEEQAVDDTDTYRPTWDDDDDEVAPRTATASAWLIALWPVLTLLALVAAGYIAFSVSFEPSIAGIPLVLGVAIVPYLLGIVWAITDGRKLRRLGEEAPSPAWSLLGPFVYLIARRVKVRGGGPLALFIVLFLLAAGGPTAAVLTGAAKPVLTAIDIQQTVSADLVGSGRAESVSCPFLVESTSVGRIYTCSATLADGTRKTVFVSIDSLDGDYSYALSTR